MFISSKLYVLQYVYIAELLKLRALGWSQTEIAEKLMKLQKSKKEVNNLDGVAALADQGTVNNNVFIGSTAELQKMLRDEIVIDVEEGQ